MDQDEDWDSPSDIQYQPQREYVPQQQYRQTRPANPDDLLVDIDSQFAGLIIGKGGSVIKGLRKETGAFISVLDSDSYGLKTVKISGNQKARDHALKLVNDIVDANNPEKIKQKLQQESEQAPVQSTFNWDELMKEEAENLKQRLAALPPIVKNFYKEHPEVTRMTDQEVEDFRMSKNNIMIKYIEENNDKPIPKPVLKFSHAFEDYPDILEEIQKQKFEVPSPVQCQTWPVIMSGHDLIAIAQTGTGKTLAFLLPAFIHIDFQPTPRSERKGPSILVLAPTRELVLQIESEVKKYSYKGIKAMSIYGGASSGKQKEVLRKGVEIVIATPGRLNDFVGSGAIDLSDVTFLILDEADRMLDLGFEPQIRVSLLRVRPDRQTIMTSATWPPGVKRLAKSYTTNPIQVMVGSLDLTTVNTVKQDILIMDEEEKEVWLDDFLKSCSADDKIIIFVNRKVTVDQLSSDLCMKGYIVESIHGGREQCDREMALESLRNGEVNILIATDVASRGIDINDITVVINYDFTKDIEEYVHRVGRTGRAGKTGLAITLMTRRDWGKAKDLVEVMEKSGQDVPPELQEMASRYEAKKERDRAEGGDRPFRGGRGGGRGFSRGDGGFSGNRRNNY
ncbi:probable ATP-dependent RNA helicase DDX43 [Acyrthosiphon pisum]|uniref:RNA helicase n=1 Tax=Acyrthosiphon pisum TaxID=7029 RepID=A0A8R1W3G3_ACYPI|nr:probable ATP-dependent RNA helicase DDX43 [Acyrthosiphon pisum]|eukprot:XP_001952274.1 PREDICTED: probable ATP-dependent RNA helicase DDX43 [Acyrthosiphon pisum]